MKNRLRLLPVFCSMVMAVAMLGACEGAGDDEFTGGTLREGNNGQTRNLDPDGAGRHEWIFTATKTVHQISLTDLTADYYWTLMDIDMETLYGICDEFGDASDEVCNTDTPTMLGTILTVDNDYTLLVDSNSRESSKYTLTIDFDGDAGGGDGGGDDGCSGSSFNSEGTMASPIQLTLETSHCGEVGDIMGSEPSYYRVRLSRAGSIRVPINDNSETIYTSFYRDSSYSDFIGFCINSASSTTECESPLSYSNYDPGYAYIKVDPAGRDGAGYSIEVTMGSSEGSVANPVSITVNNPLTTGSVRVDGASYYTFTAPTSAIHTITLSSQSPSATVGWVLYSEPDFSNFVGLGSCDRYSTGAGCETISALTAGAPYYLRITSSIYAASDTTYTVDIQ